MWHRHRVRKQIPQRRKPAETGLTLLELIITCAILLVLSTAALPVAKYTLIRQKETQLHHDLLMMREAIDRYKDAADHNQIKVEIGSEGYPPDLETLTKEIQLGSGGDKKIRFLRAIPLDAMTGQADWGLRAVGDEADSQNWGGKNVFDIYSKSTGTAMDGTKYADW